MNAHAVILPFSEEWIFWNSITFVFIGFLIFIGKKLDNKSQLKFAKFLAIFFALEFVAIQSYYVHQGIWMVQESLPFHLCRLMWFAAMITLLTRHQIAFELLLFVGMAGGLHSLLTPELTHGVDFILLVDYFLVHGGLIAVPLYCVFIFGMRPRRMAWLKAFFYLQIPVAAVAIIDFILGANYMYLVTKPSVENLFLIGDWPYYIIGLELATLLHAFIVYLPFYFKKEFLKH